MEEQGIQQISYSDEELESQKKQKSRNRVFGILLSLCLLLFAIFVAEVVILIVG